LNLDVSVPGYTNINQIHANGSCLFFRAVREKDGLSVVLKLLNLDHPTRDEVIGFRREYEFGQALNLPLCVSYLDLFSQGNRLIIVRAYVEGKNLAQMLIEATWSLTDKLAVARAITELLRNLHSAEVIHKNFIPQNIIWNEKTKQATLIDFRLSTYLNSEQQPFANPNAIEGNLGYISPEQTGRVNRPVDRRSDLYSLGVILFELFTGRLPFVMTSPSELVYAHLAREPDVPDTLVPDLPAQLSRVILNAMAKDENERYQSASRLLADLEHIEQAVINPELSEMTRPNILSRDRLALPSKLIGRGTELDLLNSEFETVVGGAAKMVLISGPSGIGKTALVNEIQKPILQQNGFFVSGKFDQYQRDTPYSAFGQAFDILCDYLLCEDDTILVEWRRKILNVTGDEAQRLIDITPGLERILGPQPAVEELQPQKAQERLRELFQKFVNLLSTVDHPLVLFIDDMQWADPGSLYLLEEIISDKRAGFLLMVLAYRDNEVDPLHPFSMMVEDCRTRGASILTLPITSLQPKDVQKYVEEMVQRIDPETVKLGLLVEQKTAGNAFFVGQFIKALANNQLLTFDHEQNQWTWSFEEISRRNVSSNVVDLMTQRFQSLEVRRKTVLQFAACLGARFDLRTIAQILKTEERAIFSDLRTSINEGLIIPLNLGYKIHDLPSSPEANVAPKANLIWEMPGKNDQQASRAVFKFAHDRIQEGAYASIPEMERIKSHAQIAWHLLQAEDSGSLEDRAFDIVGHFEKSHSLLSKYVDKVAVARLCLLAAKKAVRTSAFEAALSYAGFATAQLLNEESWSAEYDLCWELHYYKAYCEYTTVRFTDSETTLEICQQRSRTEDHKVTVSTLISRLLFQMNLHHKGIENTRRALAELGEAVPKKIGKHHVFTQYALFRLRLGRRKPKDLLELQTLTDEHKLNVCRILYDSVESSYMVDANAMAYFSLKIANICLKHGNSIYAPFAYGMLTMVMAGVTREYALADIFSKMTIDLNTIYPDRGVKGRTYFLAGNFVHHWMNRIEDHRDMVKTALHCNQDTGSLHWANYSIFFCRVQSLFFNNASLDDIIEDNILAYNLFRKNNDREVYLQQNHILNYCLWLRGDDSPFLTNETDFNREDYDREMLEPGNMQVRAYYHMVNAAQTCLMEDFEHALEHARQGLLTIPNILGNLAEVPIRFLFLLCKLNTCSGRLSAAVTRAQPTYQKNRLLLRRFARINPAEYLALDMIIHAEEARVSGKKNIGNLYDRAVQEAEKNGYPFFRAMANELAAKYYMMRNRLKIAGVYMYEAVYFYGLWGAEEKVRLLRLSYEDLLVQFHPATVSSEEAPTDNLDLAAVLGATQAISSELDRTKLLSRLLEIIIENAGAEYGALVSARNDGFWLEALVDKNGVDIPDANMAISGDENRLCQASLRYVSRTNEPLIVHDTAADDRFARDPYILQKGVRSLLCLPFRHHEQETDNLLYLENNLTTGAFSVERVSVLNILLGQAAISLQNANMFEEQKRLEKQIRHSQKMEAVGQLTGGIAHDFNNILGIVQGNFEILQQLVKNDEKAATRIAAGLKGTARGASLTRKLLDFSRRETGSIKRVSINDFIRDMEDLIIKSLTVSIDVNLHLETETWQVDIDPGDLQDVVLNLALNARDAMPDGGNLGIKSCNKTLDENYVQRFSEAKAGDYVMLSVIDTGHGMTAEVRERVLEPFFTTKEQGKGTGLGLAMAYGFIQRSNGHLEINSEPGKGTEINLFLPRAKQKQTTDVETKMVVTNVLPTGTGTVLVVDDEEDLREIAVIYIEGLGYETLTAENGHQALEILGNGHDIALLFSDVVMPGPIDGYQLAMSAHERDPELKILLTSGFTKKQSTLRAAGDKLLFCRNERILKKPYNQTELAYALKKTLNQPN